MICRLLAYKMSHITVLFNVLFTSSVKGPFDVGKAVHRRVKEVEFLLGANKQCRFNIMDEYF